MYGSIAWVVSSDNRHCKRAKLFFQDLIRIYFVDRFDRTRIKKLISALQIIVHQVSKAPHLTLRHDGLVIPLLHKI